MFKGWVVLLILGLGFMYLVNIFLGQAESENATYETRTTKTIERENFAKYHKKDFNGDNVLDLSTLSLEEGTTVWIDSDIKSNIISNFPNFDAMKQMIENQLVDSATKTFLLEKFSEVEAKYLSGEMSSSDANNMLTYLRYPTP